MNDRCILQFFTPTPLEEAIAILQTVQRTGNLSAGPYAEVSVIPGHYFIKAEGSLVGLYERGDA